MGGGYDAICERRRRECALPLLKIGRTGRAYEAGEKRKAMVVGGGATDGGASDGSVTLRGGGYDGSG